MEVLNTIVEYIFSFEPYVVLPIIIFVISLFFQISVSKALRSSLTIGIGFIGIFIILAYFVEKIGPAVESLTARTGLEYKVLDVGWPPLAAISWSYYLAPLLIVLIIMVNMIMLGLKKTRTVNVDIWNFWHFIFLAKMVHVVTNNIILAATSALLLSIVTIKLADWSARRVNKFANLSGISITTLSGVVYYPVALIGDKLLSKVKFLNKIDADPEYLKEKLGLIGEPMVIGFILGIFLGIGAGYDLKGVLELAFSIAAVIYILPIMAGVLGKGLMQISEGMKEFIKDKFPDSKEIYIGLDLAILLGNPSIIVTGILLMPAALLLAFVIPGVNFLPLGDLTNTIAAVSMVVVAVRGNILRSFIIFIPIMIGKLLVASKMAGMYTDLAEEANFNFQGYDGLITGFLDGGNLFRYWFLKLFESQIWAFFLIPVVCYLLWYTKKSSENDLQPGK
ncbi:MAG: PTS galactitol transporter subunit IIC [Halanaerobiales bacterium]